MVQGFYLVGQECCVGGEGFGSVKEGEGLGFVVFLGLSNYRRVERMQVGGG